MPTKTEPLTVAEMEYLDTLVRIQSGDKVTMPRKDFERILVTALIGAKALDQVPLR